MRITYLNHLWVIKVASAFILVFIHIPRIAAQSADAIKKSKALFQKAEIALQENKSKDFKILLEEALKLNPKHPKYLLNYSYALVLNDDIEGAISELNQIAQMGIYFNISEINEFEALRKRKNYDRVLKKFIKNKQPVGKAKVLLELTDKDLLIEGIALDDKDSTIYLSSVHKNKIIKFNTKNNFIDSIEVSLSPMGIKIDPQHEFLWITMAGVFQGNKTSKSDYGSSGIAKIDIHNFRLIEEIIIEKDSSSHIFGDIIINDDGLFYLSDSKGAKIYSFNYETSTLTPLTKKGELISPQGLLESNDKRNLIVSDYSIGLVSINKKTGRIIPLKNGTSISLLGIDGIYRYKNKIIGVQNGLKPHRILKLKLNSSESKIIDYEVIYANEKVLDDPTLGTIIDNYFYLNANSQWQKFSSGSNSERKFPKIIRIKLE